MKYTVPVEKPIRPSWSGLTALLLFAVIQTSAMKNELRSTAINDSIIVQKSITSQRYKIRLYPNVDHQVLFFSASGQQGKVYQFFLFDVDGKLVKRVNIRNKETTVLINIEKGSYVFEVFSDDDRIENGQLFVR